MKYRTGTIFLGILLFIPWLSYAEDTDFSKQLRFGGYISTYLYQSFVPRDDLLYSFFSHDPGFSVSKLDAFVESRFASKWRFFGELEFTYTPYGFSSADSPTSSVDGQTYINPIAKKSEQNDGLIIQRAFVDYNANDLLAFRIGQYLTPFGIWNEDHGDPILTSITLPDSVTVVTYAQAQAGAQIFGKWFATNSMIISYNLYAGNGNGTQVFSGNPGGRFSFGGRVQADLFDSLTLNVSYYNGDTTYSSSDYVVTSSLQHNVYGASLKFSYSDFTVQSEYIHENVDDTKGAYHSYVQDLYYAQAEYTFWNFLIPYARYERLNLDSLSSNIYSGGINFRILPQVLIKTNVQHDSVESKTLPTLKGFTKVAVGLTVLF